MCLYHTFDDDDDLRTMGDDRDNTEKDKTKQTKQAKEYAACLKAKAAEKKDDKKKKNEADDGLCSRGYCTAKLKYKVYPSAYANGYAAQVCSGDRPDLKGQTRPTTTGKDKGKGKGEQEQSGLRRWFDEEWVNVCEKDKNGEYPPCGRPEAKLQKETYPYCRPRNKLKGTTVKTVGELSEDTRRRMCAKKRDVEPEKGAPKRVFLSGNKTDRQ